MPYDQPVLTPFADPAPEPAPEARLEVMTRTVRLPTASRAQARDIIRLQLDRLSPLPRADILFDVVPLDRQGGETRYALGVVRKAALDDPAFTRRRLVEVRRLVDGAEAVFRFRNPFMRSDWEPRLLRHAPAALVVCAGLAALMLAAADRSERRKERRLPEIAREAVVARRAAEAETTRISSLTAWAGLEHGDAATRALCVLTRLEQTGAVWTVQGLRAGAEGVSITFAPPLDAVRLAAIGASVDATPDADGHVAAAWEDDQCA